METGPESERLLGVFWAKTLGFGVRSILWRWR
jgi:hypothetical protein